LAKGSFACQYDSDYGKKICKGQFQYAPISICLIKQFQLYTIKLNTSYEIGEFFLKQAVL
jgi:hypothetical protein